MAIAIVFIVGCKKESSVPANTVESAPIIYIPTGSNMNAPVLLMDSIWYPVSSGNIEIAFGSDGTYYEDEINSASIQGVWKVRSPDSLVITKQFWYVQYRIVSVTADTLKLVNVGNFISTYHH